VTAHRGRFVAYYRVSTAEQGRSGLGLEAQQRIDAAEAAQKLVEAVSAAEHDLQDQEAKARSAVEIASQSTAKLAAAESQLRGCDELERALDVQAAEERVADNDSSFRRRSKLRARS
jgi:hypothetical protein